jgi:hypothetical protein
MNRLVYKHVAGRRPEHRGVAPVVVGGRRQLNSAPNNQGSGIVLSVV